MSMWREPVRTISCGEYHTLVVTEHLELKAWGGNYFGQVGIDSTADAHFPVSIIGRDKGVSDAKCIVEDGVVGCAAGRCHSLAVTAAGEVYAWGNNEDCLLGTGWKMKQETPLKVISSGVKAVAAGWKHCLALTDAGEVLAWGGNEYGQLGDGSRTAHRAPVKVISGRVRAIASGWYHNLALTDSGDVLTWGFTSQDPSSGHQRSLTPQLIIGGGIKAISAGGSHSLALTEEGNILAWGSNDHGQLGDGTTRRRITPVTVATKCISVAAGSYHSMALDENYNVVEWGFKMSGSPNGDGAWRSEVTPARVFFEGGAFAITAGGVHSLAVSHKGEVFTWGSNSYGQIGDGKITDREYPACILPPGTLETIPAAEIIAKIMKGPEELEAHVKREHKQRDRRTRSTPGRASDRGVPELLHKIAGDHPSLGARLGATYPLSFDGCEGLAKSSVSTGSLGFIPGTGFRPGSMGNTMQALQWPDGPGTLNGSIMGGVMPRKRPSFRVQALSLLNRSSSGPRTDPSAFAALADSASVGSGRSGGRQALALMAATDGFGRVQKAPLMDCP